MLLGRKQSCLQDEGCGWGNRGRHMPGWGSRCCFWRVSYNCLWKGHLCNRKEKKLYKLQNSPAALIVIEECDSLSESKWFTFLKPIEFARGHILHWIEQYCKPAEMKDETVCFWKGEGAKEREKDVHRWFSWKRSGAVITGCFPMSGYCTAQIYPPSTPLTLTLCCHSRIKWNYNIIVGCPEAHLVKLKSRLSPYPGVLVRPWPFAACHYLVFPLSLSTVLSNQVK